MKTVPSPQEVSNSRANTDRGTPPTWCTWLYSACGGPDLAFHLGGPGPEAGAQMAEINYLFHVFSF